MKKDKEGLKKEEGLNGVVNDYPLVSSTAW